MGKSNKVMLVEDDATMQAVLRTLLEIEGFQVVAGPRSGMIWMNHCSNPSAMKSQMCSCWMFTCATSTGMMWFNSIRADADIATYPGDHDLRDGRKRPLYGRRCG